MRPSAQPFLWKCVLFAWEWNHFRKGEHLTSFWYRGPGELGSGRPPYCLFYFVYPPEEIKHLVSLYIVRVVFSQGLLCIVYIRLRVVPHFSSGIVEQAKRESAWKSPHARKGDTRGVIFTRARVSLALLSLRKNGGLPRSLCIQLFRERLSEKVHATIPKGIVGGFEFTFLQRNLKEFARKAMKMRLRVLKESNKSRFDSYSRQEQCIDHIPYYLSGLSRAHFFRQPFSKYLYTDKFEVRINPKNERAIFTVNKGLRIY